MSGYFHESRARTKHVIHNTDTRCAVRQKGGTVRRHPTILVPENARNSHKHSLHLFAHIRTRSLAFALAGLLSYSTFRACFRSRFLQRPCECVMNYATHPPRSNKRNDLTMGPWTDPEEKAAAAPHAAAILNDESQTLIRGGNGGDAAVDDLVLVSSGNSSTSTTPVVSKLEEEEEDDALLPLSPFVCNTNKRLRLQHNDASSMDDPNNNNHATSIDNVKNDNNNNCNAVAVVIPSSVATTNNQSSSDDHSDSVKLAKMSAACKTILECIGEDPNREGLVKTPERWAKALLFMCQGYCMTPADVTNEAVFYENHNEMVVVRNIDIHSLCEHHMVPFSGRVHIGYIPNGKILGLSKLARIAELYARRLQVQERLTRQIADAVLETIEPLGVAVVVECTHFCMVMRGVQKTGALTTTSSVRGCFETNPKTRAEFFSIIHGGVKYC